VLSISNLRRVCFGGQAADSRKVLSLRPHTHPAYINCCVGTAVLPGVSCTFFKQHVLCIQTDRPHVLILVENVLHDLHDRKVSAVHSTCKHVCYSVVDLGHHVTEHHEQVGDFFQLRRLLACHDGNRHQNNDRTVVGIWQNSSRSCSVSARSLH